MGRRLMSNIFCAAMSAAAGDDEGVFAAGQGLGIHVYGIVTKALCLRRCISPARARPVAPRRSCQ